MFTLGLKCLLALQYSKIVVEGLLGKSTENREEKKKKNKRQPVSGAGIRQQTNAVSRLQLQIPIFLVSLIPRHWTVLSSPNVHDWIPILIPRITAANWQNVRLAGTENRKTRMIEPWQTRGRKTRASQEQRRRNIRKRREKTRSFHRVCCWCVLPRKSRATAVFVCNIPPHGNDGMF